MNEVVTKIVPPRLLTPILWQPRADPVEKHETWGGNEKWFVGRQFAGLTPKPQLEKRSPEASFAKDTKRARGLARRRRFGIIGLVFLVQIAEGDPWCSSC